MFRRRESCLDSALEFRAKQIDLARVVVDTGPLLSVLVLRYAHTLEPRAAEALIARSRIASYLHAMDQQASILQLFERVDTILTSSHVIAEIQGLHRLRGDYCRDFWLLTMDWLESKRLDERLIRLLDLSTDQRWKRVTSDIGPTDTGLITIAFREGIPLLTDDKDTLARQGWEQGIDCQLVEGLL